MEDETLYKPTEEEHIEERTKEKKQDVPMPKVQDNREDEVLSGTRN